MFFSNNWAIWMCWVFLCTMHFNLCTIFKSWKWYINWNALCIKTKNGRLYWTNSSLIWKSAHGNYMQIMSRSFRLQSPGKLWAKQPKYSWFWNLVTAHFLQILSSRPICPPMVYRDTVLKNVDHLEILGSHIAESGSLNDDLDLHMKKRFSSCIKFYN